MKRVPSPFHARFLRKSRSLYDRYVDSVKPWSRGLWYEWVGVRPGMSIVDVGCGIGHFSRFLARGLKGRGQVIGFDNRENLLDSAAKETNREKLSRLVQYRIGDAYKLPLPDNTADLVTCRTVLMHLKDAPKAISEMVRVAKKGGLVSAVEADFQMRCYYSPLGEARNRLVQSFSEAWLKGIASLEGKDYSIGSKLPTLFTQAGLVEVRANLDADPWLNCDPRRSIREKLRGLRTSLEELRDFDETRKYLAAGGMSSRDIESYRKQSIKECTRLVREPQLVLHDSTFYGACWFLV